MAVDERTPLLSESHRSGAARLTTTANRVLLAGFLISVALSFTQVPILYVFRLMECDEFYLRHAPPEGGGGGDRCSRNEIDGGTAAQVSLLGLSTTCCGVLNLFFTGWQIRRWGPRFSLALQTLFCAGRAGVQVAGVAVGAGTGIAVVQLSQLAGLVGGVSGYLLVLNTIAGEAVAPADRTAMFGRLQGSVMLGTAVGFLLGGVVGDTLGIRRPFEVAAALFAASSLYAATCIPYIDPAALVDGDKPVSRGVGAAFSPLKMLAPQRLRLSSGLTSLHWGTTFLALGVFLGVLATGYAPMLIQMYATAAFDFHPTDNGYLMATNSLIRGFFLIFLFPRIISAGRVWFSRQDTTVVVGPPVDGDRPIPTEPEEFEPTAGILPGQEPGCRPNPSESHGGQEFDLFFLRWSLVVDGLVTAYTAAATQGWHIYLAGFLLPLASGSAPASKGVITEMCSPSQRTDALQAMSLVENVAMLSTLGLFGFIFSLFSDMGKSYYTFGCNAAVALFAVLVLLFSRFPPQGTMSRDDEFELYDLRVEVVCPPGERIMCGAKEGDYFTLEGEMLYLPPGQGISVYSLASVLPLLAAKQRTTHAHDWMSTDALIACPDPNCKSQLKIVRTGVRKFSHGDTTVVGLEGNS
ncbi:MFS general substrate transporter [Xylariaceae sp. FL0804]|nr:MFS general substrate transporter [Xylariaceae sp. FL0804]